MGKKYTWDLESFKGYSPEPFEDYTPTPEDLEKAERSERRDKNLKWRKGNVTPSKGSEINQKRKAYTKGGRKSAANEIERQLRESYELEYEDREPTVEELQEIQEQWEEEQWRMLDKEDLLSRLTLEEVNDMYDTCDWLDLEFDYEGTLTQFEKDYFRWVNYENSTFPNIFKD